MLTVMRGIMNIFKFIFPELQLVQLVYDKGFIAKKQQLANDSLGDPILERYNIQNPAQSKSSTGKLILSILFFLYFMFPCIICMLAFPYILYGGILDVLTYEVAFFEGAALVLILAMFGFLLYFASKSKFLSIPYRKITVLLPLLHLLYFICLVLSIMLTIVNEWANRAPFSREDAIFWSIYIFILFRVAMSLLYWKYPIQTKLNEAESANHEGKHRFWIASKTVAFIVLTIYTFSTNSITLYMDDVQSNGIGKGIIAGATMDISDESVSLSARDFTIEVDETIEEIRMQIWDFAEKDGDVISVKVNGELLHTHIKLTNTPVSLAVPSSSKVEIVGVQDGGGGITYAVRFPEATQKDAYFNSTSEGKVNVFTIKSK